MLHIDKIRHQRKMGGALILRQNTLYIFDIIIARAILIAGAVPKEAHFDYVYLCVYQLFYYVFYLILAEFPVDYMAAVS